MVTTSDIVPMSWIGPNFSYVGYGVTNGHSQAGFGLRRVVNLVVVTTHGPRVLQFAARERDLAARLEPPLRAALGLSSDRHPAPRRRQMVIPI